MVSVSLLAANKAGNNSVLGSTVLSLCVQYSYFILVKDLLHASSSHLGSVDCYLNALVMLCYGAILIYFVGCVIVIVASTLLICSLGCWVRCVSTCDYF